MSKAHVDLAEYVPAFPVPTQAINAGMRLRDFFASMALLGLVANGRASRNRVAQESYAYADAMLEARKERVEP